MADGATELLLDGEILPGDADRILPLLTRLSQQGGVARLALNSPGGNIIEADELARFIRNTGLSVAVMSGQMCASACFLLFAASPERYASPSARIGVHSASMDGDENLLTLDITTIMAREAAAFGVPPDIIGQMVTTPPAGMAWLTAVELSEMAVQSLDTRVDAAPARPVPPASPMAEPDSQPAIVPAVPDVPVAPDGHEYRPADFALAQLHPVETDNDDAPITPHVAMHPREQPRADYTPAGSSPVRMPEYRPGF